MITIQMILHPVILMDAIFEKLFVIGRLFVTAGALITAILSRQKWLPVRSSFLRALAITMVALCAGSIFSGALIWLGAGDIAMLLLLGITELAVIFSLLWSCRAVLMLVRTSLGNPSSVMLGTGFGIVGSVSAAAMATAVAFMRGADLSRLDDVHQFYILVMPAIAGFGWTAPRLPSRSVGFAVVSFLLMLLVAFYTLPFPFVERANVRCSYPYEEPRHTAFGFQYEPWRWEQRYYLHSWALAPGALAELTLRYINQPLTGMLCDGRGDLPPELLPKPLYPPK